MSAHKGAIIGGVFALLFYVLLSSISPYDGVGVIPTANVVADPVAKETYIQNLPTSIMFFITLEIVGIILGIIGYRIISETQPEQQGK